MSNRLKLNCTVKHETVKAILVVADDQECWLPKSLIEVDKLGDDTARSSRVAGS
jgi:hypothetical protein